MPPMQTAWRLDSSSLWQFFSSVGTDRHKSLPSHTMSSRADADLEGGRQTGSSTRLHLSIYMVGKWVDAIICPCIDSGPLGLPLLMDVTSCCRAKNKAYKEANYSCHWKTQLQTVVSLHSQRWVLQTIHQIARTRRKDEVEEDDHEDLGEMSRCDNRGESNRCFSGGF